MIGLVVVCHSARLADGVVEVAAQMAGEDVRIAPAGGLDQPGDPLGTDAARVARAIDEVWSDDGVLVLMDLGSAVLSAELALELLPDERRGRVLLTAAPLVEGAVAAAVAAGLGEPLERVAAQAREGLAGKSAQLGEGAPSVGPFGRDGGALAGVVGDVTAPTGTLAPHGAGPPPLVLRVVVENPLGLHARPAAALVRAAAGFDAEVTVSDATTGRGPASARSLNDVATLGVRCGDELTVEGVGPEAGAALAAIDRLAREGFGDPIGDIAPEVSARRATVGAAAGVGVAGGQLPVVQPTPALATPALTPPAPGTVLQGLPAAPGLAVAPARRLVRAPLEVPDRPAASDPAAERIALEAALTAVDRDLRRAASSLSERGGGYEAAIFDAQSLLLRDESLLAPTRAAIETGESAARAWSAAIAAAAARWDELPDEYQRARAADLRALGDQVLARLLEGERSGRIVEAEHSGTPALEKIAVDEAGTLAPETKSPTSEGEIVLAADLSPTETAALDPALVAGLACAGGGPTSHSAILARSLGIPAVVGLGAALLAVPDGATLALDGDAGTVSVQPSAAAIEALRERRETRDRSAAHGRERAQLPAITRDGAVVPVLANIAGPGDVETALAAGADGVGLLRTEFLFLGRDEAPTEAEQERSYRAVAEGLGDRPLTLRTLDAGADKRLPWLPLSPAENPALGVRGLRLGLRRPQLLGEQLRAALRVAAGRDLRLLLPMVTTPDELRAARCLVDEALSVLDGLGIAPPARPPVGMMVEVPAAALLIEAFVGLADFFSIGTNDLAQYTLAADRGDPGVAAVADPLHPAVLELIARVARVAAASDLPVAVCGELAADPAAVPLLLGLGVTELSMAPPAIAAVKERVRQTELTEARRLAAEALAADSAAEVRELLARSGSPPPQA